MTVSLSRGPSIDTEKCVQNAGGNKYDLVLIAAARSREIQRRNKHSTKREHSFPNITALQEIEAGEIGREYLMKV